jgi:hypothetical protein
MRTPIDLSKFTTKFLKDNQELQKDRIENLKRNLENKKFNEYFPNENTLKEAIAFEENELKVIENELKKRGEI